MPKADLSPATPPSQSPEAEPGILPWHHLELEAVVERLGTDSKAGLSEAEAAGRLREHGRNEIQRVETTAWYRVFARQFTNALILILLVAAGISAALGDLTDALAIGAIVLLNGILGFIQEWKAERAVQALQRMLQPHCTAYRDGQAKDVEAATLVPGDLVEVEIGDRVPADLRLVESVSLRADESSLTGESLSVHKHAGPVAEEAPIAERSSIAWMGTTITDGRALGLVIGTGMGTEFGRIAHLTQTVAPEATPLQRKLGVLAKQLGVASIAVAALVGLLGALLGRPWLDMVLTGVSLAVAVVPEGLPAVVTITLALGIRTMAKRRALLRRLQAAETLGAATVICTDKTGTLTENEMTVREIWLPGGAVRTTGSGYDPEGHFEVDGEKIDYRRRPDLLAALQTGLLCNHARLSKEEGEWRELGEPTEAALVVAAYKAWLSRDEDAARVAEFSFSSGRKRMTVITRDGETLVAHVKGAPEVILERCVSVLDGDTARPLSDEDRKTAEEAYHAMAEQGLRTLALARRELPADASLTPGAVERDLTLLGIVGILDPPRPEVPDAVAMSRRAGVSVIMITGDAPATALAVARQAGLDARTAITGSELDRLDDRDLLEALGGDVVFARTLPEQKLRIVELLQRRGQVVAMTGDGVNDAPALKRADIGIAMGIRGTDVSKDASDMIIADDNFASIVGAVEEGRRQFDNIQKFVRYLLSSNVGEVTAIVANLLVGGPLILLPVQILWMNLVTDGVTALALGAEPAEKGLMERPPRDPGARIMNRFGLFTVLALGVYIGAATLWLFQHYRTSHGPEGLIAAQTVAFTGIILLEKMNVFNFRALKAPMSVTGFFSNRWLLLAWAGMIGLQAAAVYAPPLQRVLRTVPLTGADWVHMAALAAPVFLLPELLKWLAWRPAAGAPGTADVESGAAGAEPSEPGAASSS